MCVVVSQGGDRQLGTHSIAHSSLRNKHTEHTSLHIKTAITQVNIPDESEQPEMSLPFPFCTVRCIALWLTLPKLSIKCCVNGCLFLPSLKTSLAKIRLSSEDFKGRKRHV